MADKSIITSMCWVSKGYAKNVSVQHEPSKAELQSYSKLHKRLAKKDYQNAAKEIEAKIGDINLDNYDKEDNMPAFSDILA